MKTCTYCKEEKELVEFSKNCKSKDGLQHRCKKCRHKPSKRIRVKNGFKFCNKCKTEKEINEFREDKSKKSGFHSNCKSCLSERGKKYSKENKEHRKEYNKEYRKNNTEKMKQRDKEYYQENKEQKIEWQKEYYKKNVEKIIQQKKEYKRERYQRDPQFRATQSLRARTRKGIKNQGGYKSASTEELLGCTFKEANLHIENQFLPGMSWENHGEWEIDHIRPMASFDLTDPQQQRECCHHTNLRPMWWKENRSKGSLWNGIKHYHTNPN